MLQARREISGLYQSPGLMSTKYLVVIGYEHIKLFKLDFNIVNLSWIMIIFTILYNIFILQCHS
jgi:hypothetical protein